MAQLNTPIDDVPRSATAARIGWALLILATLYVCYFSHLGAIGFVGPDEPRYAWIARDMAESGDWVTPRLYGKPWFEKPVLYYWGAALSFKLLGVSEAAARLPSAISALLATLALAWLALRIYGPETARWLLLLLPTTVGMIGFSHAAATDMPFSAMLTIATVAAAVLLRLIPNLNGSLPQTPNTVISNVEPVSFGRAERDLRPISTSELQQQSPPAFYFTLVLFGFFLGLAVLAKGPAAIILSGGAVFFWAILTKRWRDAFRLLHPVAIASFCLTALPWYILCARRNPDFFRVFIIEHNFKRYLTPEFQHIQPFWYYIPILALALMPWTAMTFSGLWMFRKKFRMKPDATSIYLLTWACFTIFFFSTSHSKLPGYILPSIPAFGLITAVATAFFRRRWQLVLLCGIMGLVTFVEVAELFKAQSLDYVVSPRHLAERIQSDKQVPLNQLTLSKVSRAERYVLSFYFRRELQEWDQDPTREAYILVDSFGPGCKQLGQTMMDCSDLWGNLEAKRKLPHLLHVTPRTFTAHPAP